LNKTSGLKLSGFARFAWGVLAYNLAVILWGAYVRASGSGAGCGSHWPLCNGVIVPHTTRVETLIEFTHRVMSGLAFLFVIALMVSAFRLYKKGSLVRFGASLSTLFMVGEAMLGAGLVLFELVAENASLARAFSISFHLVNTFLLLASLSLTAWWASDSRPVQSEGKGVILGVLGVAMAGMLLLGMSGAVTALGDTLFPARSLAEGVQQDLSSTAHFLIRLRFLHPSIAILVGLYLILTARWLPLRRQEHITDLLAKILIILVILQLSAGITNVFLLAPIWMQIIHLLLSDLLWIILVLLAASAMTQRMMAGSLLRSPQNTPISPGSETST
jgi:heme A synthase